jgi:hypothetical protein
VSDADPVMRSFEIAADRTGDITSSVYERYFASCAGSKTLMSHIDGYVQGRMLEEVIELLLSDRPETLQDYLHFETKTHVSYGVEEPMYGKLLAAVRDTVRDALANDWNGEYAQAWDDRIDMLLAEIARASHG